MHPFGHLSLVSGSVWIRIRLSYAWNRFGSLVQGFLHRLARFFYVLTSLNALEHVISWQFCCALLSFSAPCTSFVLCIWTYISCWDISYGILHCAGVWVELFSIMINGCKRVWDSMRDEWPVIEICAVVLIYYDYYSTLIYYLCWEE